MGHDEKTICKRCIQFVSRMQKINTAVALLAAEQLHASKITIDQKTLDTFNSIIDLTNVNNIDKEKV